MWWLLYVSLGVIGFIFILMCLVSYLMCRYYAKPHAYPYEESIKFLKSINGFHDFDKVPKEEFIIKLKSGYELNALYMKAKEESNKYVILCHGFTVNQMYTSKYYEVFNENGFNVISYDERSHGRNKKDTCGMSHFERYDLLEVIDYVYERFGKDIYLGLHGESMGAATVVSSLKFNPNVKFVIADCPFSNLKDVSIKSAKDQFHMPKIVVDLAGPIGKLFFGYNPNKVRPVDDINNSKVPLLLCHGDKDELVPIKHSYEIYDSYNSYKELYVTKGAIHAQSATDDFIGYKKKVTEFLNKIKEI